MKAKQKRELEVALYTVAGLAFGALLLMLAANWRAVEAAVDQVNWWGLLYLAIAVVGLWWLVLTILVPVMVWRMLRIMRSIEREIQAMRRERSTRSGESANHRPASSLVRPTSR